MSNSVFKPQCGVKVTSCLTDMDTFKGDRFNSKTIQREERECKYWVGRDTGERPLVGPSRYSSPNMGTAFEINKTNSIYYGSRAVRNIEPENFSALHNKFTEKGIFLK